MSFRIVAAVVTAAVAAGLPCPTTANAQGAGAGAYTQPQADRGRRIYGAFCATCHSVELEGATIPRPGEPGAERPRFAICAGGAPEPPA